MLLFVIHLYRLYHFPPLQSMQMRDYGFVIPGNINDRIPFNTGAP